MMGSIVTALRAINTRGLPRGRGEYGIAGRARFHGLLLAVSYITTLSRTKARFARNRLHDISASRTLAFRLLRRTIAIVFPMSYARCTRPFKRAILRIPHDIERQRKLCLGSGYNFRFASVWPHPPLQLYKIGVINQEVGCIGVPRAIIEFYHILSRLISKLAIQKVQIAGVVSLPPGPKVAIQVRSKPTYSKASSPGGFSQTRLTYTTYAKALTRAELPHPRKARKQGEGLTALCASHIHRWLTSARCNSFALQTLAINLGSAYCAVAGFTNIARLCSNALSAINTLVCRPLSHLFTTGSTRACASAKWTGMATYKYLAATSAVVFSHTRIITHLRIDCNLA